MIIPELHLFQIEREPFFRDAVELDDALLGVAPETFNAVDVDLPVAKMLSMVDIDVPVTAEHERIITLELVCVNDAAAPDHLDRQVKQRLSLDILNRLDMDAAISLEDTEDGDFIGRPASAFALTLAAKVGFVQFNGPIQPIRRSDTLPDRLSDDLNGFKGRWITQAHLGSNLAGRDLQFKELNDPQPLLRADLNVIDPTVAEVMEGVTTPLATIPFTQQPVDFIAVAPAARNMPFFPAEFAEVQSGSILTFDDELKGF